MKNHFLEPTPAPPPQKAPKKRTGGLAFPIIKDITITISIIVIIASIGGAVLWLWVTNGETTTLYSIHYFSGTIYNESTSELINATTSINSTQYTVITNWSEIPINQTYGIGYFRAVAGIYYNYSFQFIIQSNQSIYYKTTELKNYFEFILFSHDDGRIQFVSGLKTLWRTGWHKDDANFQKHRKLAHQTAMQKTQEILEILDLHPPEEISFREDYI